MLPTVRRVARHAAESASAIAYVLPEGARAPWNPGVMVRMRILTSRKHHRYPGTPPINAVVIISRGSSLRASVERKKDADIAHRYRSIFLFGVIGLGWVCVVDARPKSMV